ncbi:MAG: efflux RND transporter periplasmic adaptor subunit, partial [Desulfarculus sp.]|nr:efflux RND transporter periplasmic adaptor subunit [Desulfarculus sp.]
AQARQEDVPVAIKAIGKVEALATVAIKARVTGQLVTVHFKEGQFVKKGDLLFTIDPAPFQVALREAQAQAARDQALAVKAVDDLKRYQELIGRKAVSTAQFEQFQAEAKAKEATAQASQAQVDKARLELGWCQITAPVGGQTGGLLAYAGNLIKANDDNKVMVTITQVQPVQVSFAVPEQYLGEIRRHQAAAPLSVSIRPEGENETTRHGELVFVDNAVDTATGTIRLKASYPNQDLGLWPGQFVNVRLNLTTRRGVTVVPSQALQSGQVGDYVFVLKPDQTVEARGVKTSLVLEEVAVVDQGLKPGETVVTEGQLRLADGSRVAVKPAVGAPPAAPQGPGR